MNLRSLLSIILKIIGLYVTFAIFIPSIINNVDFVQRYLTTDTEDMVSVLFRFFLFTILSSLIYAAISYLLIIKSDWIINQIPFNSKEEEITGLNVNRTAILTSSVIIIGGLTLFEALPIIIKQLINFSPIGFMGREVLQGFNFDRMIIPGLKIIIGLFLVFGNKTVVNWIDSKNRIKEQSETV
jgi:hypothetical protein